MTVKRRKVALCALALLLAWSGGCGKDTERNGEVEDFRVPDSLLVPLQEYLLTVDEYDPVRGGVMANDRIEVHYPSSQIARYTATRIFGEALAAHELATNMVGRPARVKVVVIGSRDLDEYAFLTRKQWWYYGVIQGDTIICQPFDIMMKRFDPITRRSLSEIGLEQKIVQMALDRVSAGALPIWLREAVASHFANERPVLRVQVEEFRRLPKVFAPGLDELEHILHVAEDRAETRSAFFFAYRMLERLLERATLEDVIGFARRLGAGEPLDDASRAAFGMPYLDLVESIRPADLFDGAGEVELPAPEHERRHGHE